MLVQNYSTFKSFTTDRLIIRTLLDTDLFELHALRSDESLNQYTDREIAMDLDETKEFIQKISELIKNNLCLYWVIVDKDQNKLIGTICYWNFNFNKEEAEIGYELLPEYQGKGIMQEAVQCLIHFGFEILKMKTISAFVSSKNIKSIALLNKFDFNIVPKNSSVKIVEGNLKDMIHYELLKEDYLKC
jgi:ribosomal-protein-alanine N-acetyltransferase